MKNLKVFKIGTANDLGISNPTNGTVVGLKECAQKRQFGVSRSQVRDSVKVTTIWREFELYECLLVNSVMELTFSLLV